MVSDSSAVRRLAARLLQVERGLRNVSTVPQLGRSSLDDEALTLRDGDGNVMGRVGRQEDGTYGSTTLDGPTPVAPASPVASGGPGSLTVEWDGRFKDDAAAPLDFHVVEIYVATEPFSDTADARLLGHFSNEAGGEITVARPKGEQHVGLVTKARSGKRSELSPLATAVVESVVDQETVDELNDALENMPSITWLNRAPEPADGEGKPVGAVWRELNDDGEIVGEYEWDGDAWVARPISGDAVTSLEVGKLTAAFSQLDEVVANQIFADIFAANQITAANIDTETLGADSGFIGVLNSAEIVGAIIKTAATGMRVELDSANGIRIYNKDNLEVLSADANGDLVLAGDMTLSGRITTGGAISNIQMGHESLVVNSSAPGIEMDRWYSVPLRGFSSIDQINGFVVGTTRENPSLMILNSNGEIYAFRNAGNARADSVTITGGYAYVTHPNGLVWRAEDPFISFSVWSTARRADKISSHSSGGVYGIHADDNAVFSYNSSGGVAWTKTHSNPTSIHVTSNRVFVGLTGTTNRVLELDLSGNLIQEFTVNHFGEYLLVQDGVAYISNADDKKVYVEELGSGQVLLTLSQGGEAVPGGLMNYQGNLAVAWRSPTTGSSEGGISFHSFTDDSKEMVRIDSSSGVLRARSARLPGHSSIKSAEMSVIAPPVGESLNIINPLFRSGFNIVKSKAERLNSYQSFQEGAIVSEAGGITGQSLWMRSSSRQDNNHPRNWIKIGPSAESLMGGDPSPSGKLSAATNLNSINRDSGGWVQEVDSRATSALNYPANVGGILRVSRRADFNEFNGEFFTQEYITREPNSRYFIRHYIKGDSGPAAWTPWTLIGGNERGDVEVGFNSNVSANASLVARYDGRTVMLDGIADIPSTWTGYQQVALLPPEVRPERNNYAVITTNRFGLVYRCRVMSSGAVEVDPGGNSNRFYVQGVTYFR